MNKNLLTALLCVLSLGFLASCGKDCCPEECDPCETSYSCEEQEYNECETLVDAENDVTAINKF
jgi:hypothetical protein